MIKKENAVILAAMNYIVSICINDNSGTGFGK